ncbi:unannotated protein [freshwater metagenome]|uniref:Unannotated protein n=1 Tax=freshwater metagenome TaxID=449393 RepID=A0A6J7LV06_9ZZZZ
MEFVAGVTFTLGAAFADGINNVKTMANKKRYFKQAPAIYHAQLS